MLNHIVLQGRICNDIELRKTNADVSVCSFRLAVDRDVKNKQTGERETDFISVTAWRSTAEFIARYFGKGRLIVVDGRLEVRDWTDKDGNKRTSAEVVAANVYFSDSKRDNDEGYKYTPQPPNASYAQSEGPGNGFEELSGDEGELPF